jgi:hypothetical protein
MDKNLPFGQVITLRRGMIVVSVAWLPVLLLGLFFPGAVEVVMPYPRSVVLAGAFTLVYTLMIRDLGRQAPAAGEADGDKEPWGWGRVILALTLVSVGVGGTLSLLFWPR